MKRSVFICAFAMLLSIRSAAQTTLFPFNSTWKYLDNGTNQGTAWRATSFSDATWKSGPGKFGYGYGTEATTISFGPDPYGKYTTTYFRKALTIANAAAFTSYTGSVKRDDGVVVYVNGTEVYRNNLPSGTITYTTLASTASDNGHTALDFTIPASAFVTGTNVVAVEVHQTSLKSFDMGFDMALVGHDYTPPADLIPPTVESINRLSPTAETTSASALTFRATFSEAVRGVDATDFALALTGSAAGTIGSVAAWGTAGTTYDVTVGQVTGSGTLGLNLKGSGTGIEDAAENPIGGGFTGQTYTLQQPAPTNQGFASVVNLSPIASRVDATKEKQQAKVFMHAGQHWAVIANENGTHLWRLDGTSWTHILRLSTRNARADCLVDGNTTHIFLFAGKSSELVSVEYVAATNTYQPWTKRKTRTAISLDDRVETGSLALDATGRMWLASDAATVMNIRYSDAPYTSWSGPIPVATGVHDDDICAVIHMPATGKIGVLWSNHNTERFGFRTHTNGTAPTAWSADEVPASQSALNVGQGLADDHLNMKVSSNGTLYAAVKTSYDKTGYPVIALLIRRPAGTWDKVYEVAQNGTRPIVLLNEAQDKLKVVYTSVNNGGDIQYNGSAMSSIDFGPQLTLIRGIHNNVTSTHQNYTSEIVILASDDTRTVGVLASDGPVTAQAPAAEMQEALQVKQEGFRQEFLAYPNPIQSAATLRFTLPADGAYSLALYDGRQVELVYQKQGTARAGEPISIDLESSTLPGGIYYARLQTKAGVKTLRLVIDK